MQHQFYIFLAFANDREDNAQYLRNLPKEMKEISNALQRLLQQGKYELIEKANVSLETLGGTPLRLSLRKTYI